MTVLIADFFGDRDLPSYRRCHASIKSHDIALEQAARYVFFRFGSAGKKEDVQTQKAHHRIERTVVQQTKTRYLRPRDVEPAHLLINIAQLSGLHVSSYLNAFEINQPVSAQR